MDNSKLSSKGVLEIIGCFIFDFALILAFFKAFGLFFIIAPDKSILMLLVLIVGLICFNGAIVFPRMLFKSMGIPYSAATSTLLVLYSILANIISVFLIKGSTVWYIVWELVVFAVFLVIFSVIAVFSKGATEDIIKAKKEQCDKTSIMLQLLEIEEILTSKEERQSILSILNLFKSLKERIQASTPFGRISGNSAVLGLENEIKNNLVSLQLDLQGNLTDKNLDELQKLIKDTLRLVINRETLNIK